MFVVCVLGGPFKSAFLLKSMYLFRLVLLPVLSIVSLNLWGITMIPYKTRI
jgi:hypothetical protein